jgi:protein-L-isoaspartate(D-aspartate) O-methyltransferase
VKPMLDHVRATLPLLHLRNVELIESRLAEPAIYGPAFDAVLIEGAVQAIPPSVLDQLKEGGRIAYVQNRGLRPDHSAGALNGTGTLMAGRKQQGRLTATPMFEASAALLPGFATLPAFQFA